MKLLDFDGAELVTADDFEFEDVTRVNRRRTGQRARAWWAEVKPRKRRRLRTRRERRG